MDSVSQTFLSVLPTSGPNARWLPSHRQASKRARAAGGRASEREQQAGGRAGASSRRAGERKRASGREQQASEHKRTRAGEGRTTSPPTTTPPATIRLSGR